MIDPRIDEMLSIRQLCRLFPGRGGRGISRATVARWMFRGVGGVRLASTKVGGARYSSRSAVDEFLAALNGQAHDGKSAPVRLARHRQLAIEAVERELDRAGI
jgi:hypothetical protein